MLLELTHPTMIPPLPPWGDAQAARHPTLFFDPLYVLHASVSARDIVLCHDVGPIAKSEFFAPAVSTLYARAYARIRQHNPGWFSSARRPAQLSSRCLATVSGFSRSIRSMCGQVRDGLSLRPAGVRTPFLLTVGAQEVRKNYIRSIEAFARSALSSEGYSYVICGPKANQTHAVEELSRRTPGVQLLGYCSDDELRWLYRNAGGFVLPSLLEGFGMPALEAAQHGLISVVSHKGALPEAVGEGQSWSIRCAPKPSLRGCANWSKCRQPSGRTGLPSRCPLGGTLPRKPYSEVVQCACRQLKGRRCPLAESRPRSARPNGRSAVR